MLRIIANTSSAGAARYFVQADYYTEGQELTGLWRGRGAARLGLSGEVSQKAWEALCHNRDPRTGQDLKSRRRDERTVGYDFNFHVPKSVSVLQGVTGDDRIVTALQKAVHDTMSDIESEMLTRVRKGGKNSERTTGNMIWGEFIHTTSRPVDGVPDPHLHAHCFVFNTTWDQAEQSWKAGQFRELKRDAPWFQAVFHTRLAKELNELGYGIERKGKAWEIAHVPENVIQKFSRRTAQIEALADAEGISDPDAKSELGAKTREKKQKSLSVSALQELWQARLTPEEEQRLKNLPESVQVFPTHEVVLNQSLKHIFERDSVVPLRKLKADLLRRGVGMLQPEQLDTLMQGQGLLTHPYDGRTFVTTPEIVEEERRFLAFAREGRGQCSPLGKTWQFEREWLSSEQKRAVLHVLQSADRVMLIRGVSGTGKTTMMQEAVAAIQAQGKRVFTFAPSADASRGVLRQAGFEEATTVAEFLTNRDLQAQLRDQLLWVDEASLLGTRSMAQVFDLARDLHCRVVLSGDRRQHQAVERGDALRLLEEEAGLVPAEIREIRRQQGEYRAAVAALSDGRLAEGFDKLDDLGWIQELPDGQREQQLASDYRHLVQKKEKVLVVSPTHAEGKRITQAIRSELKQHQMLAEEDTSLSILINAQRTEGERADPASYQRGDVLVFNQNAKGYRKGQRIVLDGTTPIPVSEAARFQVYRPASLDVAIGDWLRISKNGTTRDGKHRLNNGSLYQLKGFSRNGDLILDNDWVIAKDFQHINQGYVVTSMASQGKSIKHVLIAESSQSFPAANQQQFYVSASRGEKSLMIYTDDKSALREAIQQSTSRLTATELFASPIQQKKYQQVAHWKRLALQARAMVGKAYDLMKEQLQRNWAYER